MTQVDDKVGSIDIARASGLTYRQVTYWTEEHVLVPVVRGGGPGYPHLFNDTEIQVATILRRLTEAIPKLTMTMLWKMATDLRELIEEGEVGTRFIYDISEQVSIIVNTQ